MPAKLVLLRHGQSEWNKRNLFTGWVNIGLSKEGIEEAYKAGEKIADIPFDVIFVSSLIRAQMTAFLAMSRHNDQKVCALISSSSSHEGWDKIHDPQVEKEVIPMIAAWQLNERMYGDLQGLNKQTTTEKYGKEKVQMWRRSYDVPPPHGECLQDTAQRSIPYFKESILPYLLSGKNVLISAHGNSLRSIIMELDHLSKEEVLALELATGSPVIYEYKNEEFRKIHG